MLHHLFDASLHVLSAGAELLPSQRRLCAQLTWRRNIPYAPPDAAGSRTLDVVVPRRGDGPWPTLMYLHGGGFMVGSKETHRLVVARLAAAGFVVANINYRLAPRHRYPAAHGDVAAAWGFVVRHAPQFGGDGGPPSLMGESAGGNLALSLALALAATRPPEWAMAALDVETRPERVMVAAGLLDLAEPERFARLQPPPSWLVRRRIVQICQAALPRSADAKSAAYRWASPLQLLESSSELFGQPLPAVGISVGESDPIRSDSERLARALHQRQQPAAVYRYPRAGHVFFVRPGHAQTPQFWRDTCDFLAKKPL